MLVQQGVHKRVDGRTERDHRVTNENYIGIDVIGGNAMEDILNNGAFAPADSNYGSHSNDLQGNTFSNHYDTLCPNELHY